MVGKFMPGAGKWDGAAGDAIVGKSPQGLGQGVGRGDGLWQPVQGGWG